MAGGSGMRIVIANARMMKRTGTEIVTRDFAVGLRKRGHDVAVYAPVLGPMAEEVRAADVPVADVPAALPFAPEIVHFNNEAQVEAVLAAFPDAPGVYHCHMPGTPLGPPIRHPNVVRHYGVSTMACRRIETALGRPGDGIFGNFVDPALYARRGPLPDRPQRWLVVAEKKHALKHLARVALVAAGNGARLAAIGPRVRRRIDNVPAEAARHDLVFASARCAIEAAAAGCAVVVTDYRGSAGLLTPDNLSALLAGNCGAESFREPASIAALWRAARAYDPKLCDEASALMHRSTMLPMALAELERIYAGAVAEWKDGRSG